MKRLNHWKWQVAIAAPLMPPVYIQYGDWLYTTALGLGWGSATSGVISAILMLAMSVALITAFYKFHENDE